MSTNRLTLEVAVKKKKNHVHFLPLPAFGLFSCVRFICYLTVRLLVVRSVLTVYNYQYREEVTIIGAGRDRKYVPVTPRW